MQNNLNQTLDAYDFTAMANQRVVIAVPDGTRALDLDRMLRPLLVRLKDHNVKASILIALGLHRHMSYNELSVLRQVAQDFSIQFTQHDASGPDIIRVKDDVDLYPQEKHQWPLPAEFHSHLIETDRILCVGLVEPHQYAGFSGGVKTIAIGCAGYETISAMHGLTYLRDPRTQLGVIHDNPFQQALWRTTKTLKAAIDLYQVVPKPGTMFFEGIALGPAQETYPHLVACALATQFQTMEEAQQWVHLPVAPAKASNFYQASRAATYVSLVEGSVVEAKGWILLDAHCSEGIGRGKGEQACERLFLLGQEALYQRLKTQKDPRVAGGEQRAYVLANTLQKHNIALIGAPPISALNTLGIPQFDTMEEALKELALDPERGCTLHDVIHRVPQLQKNKD